MLSLHRKWESPPVFLFDSRGISELQFSEPRMVLCAVQEVSKWAVSTCREAGMFWECVTLGPGELS